MKNISANTPVMLAAAKTPHHHTPCSGGAMGTRNEAMIRARTLITVPIAVGSTAV